MMLRFELTACRIRLPDAGALRFIHRRLGARSRLFNRSRLRTTLSSTHTKNTAWQRVLHRFSSSRLDRIGHVLVFVAIAVYVGLTVPCLAITPLIGIVILILLGTLGSKYPHRVGRLYETSGIRHVCLDSLANGVLLLCDSVSPGCYCHTSRVWLSILRVSRQSSVEIHAVSETPPLLRYAGNEGAFRSNADAGAVFVFGTSYEEHFFVFKVGVLDGLPRIRRFALGQVTSIIIFLGSVINVLYYLGVMQYVIGKIAWIMQNAWTPQQRRYFFRLASHEGTAFLCRVGQCCGEHLRRHERSPLMIMPLVPKMTTSELHSVLVGGFATMSGTATN